MQLELVKQKATESTPNSRSQKSWIVLADFSQIPSDQCYAEQHQSGSYYDNSVTILPSKQQLPVCGKDVVPSSPPPISILDAAAIQKVPLKCIKCDQLVNNIFIFHSFSVFWDKIKS